MNFIFTEVFFKYLFHCTRPWLWHAGPSVFAVARGLFICDVWDLSVMAWELLVVHMGSSSPARDWTQARHIGSRSLSHRTTREVPHWNVFMIPSLKAFLNNSLLSWFLYCIQFEIEFFFLLKPRHWEYYVTDSYLPFVSCSFLWTAVGVEFYIPQWVAFPFSRASSQPRVEPRSPTLQEDSLPAELWGKLPTQPPLTCKGGMLLPVRGRVAALARERVGVPGYFTAVPTWSPLTLEE